jgi:uncharacterized protein with PIN domain
MLASFAADAMLKKLARWLRIFGVDVEYLDREDNDILAFLSAHPTRILLTQDVQLHERALHRRFSSFLVPRDVSTEEQIAAVFSEFGLKLDDFAARTICPACNGKLLVVGKKEVEGKVLPAVLARHEKFWLCEKCGKAYWEGTHWEKITEAAKRINSLLSQK